MTRRLGQGLIVGLLALLGAYIGLFFASGWHAITIAPPPLRPDDFYWLIGGLAGAGLGLLIVRRDARRRA